MTIVQQQPETLSHTQRAMPDMKLEVIVVPVSDVDRAKAFYARCGWREDADLTTSETFRVVQFTPPGSACSIIFGTGISTAPAGSASGLHLIVSDVEAARRELTDRGVEVSDVFHDEGGIFHHAGVQGRVAGPAPHHGSYGSFASFEDPDGNAWVMQEVTTRLPGRIDQATKYSSDGDLAEALQRAATAHGEHEARTGEYDAQWPQWYARYMVSERSGADLPL
jgi:catechol 2,3-dioxygenase-like lactoylglutathione lyase family enzyme